MKKDLSVIMPSFPGNTNPAAVGRGLQSPPGSLSPATSLQTTFSDAAHHFWGMPSLPCQTQVETPCDTILNDRQAGIFGDNGPS